MLACMCLPPQGFSGAITQVDWTRFDSVGYTDAPRALGLGGPVHRRDGAQRASSRDQKDTACP